MEMMGRRFKWMDVWINLLSDLIALAVAWLGEHEAKTDLACCREGSL
jgi:hypothetical protein